MEIPKPKKEPKKKKPKWPLFAAGAIAAGAGWYALTGEKSKASDQSENRTDEISEITPVDKTRLKIGKKLSDQLARAEDDEKKKKILELIRQMQGGNHGAATIVTNYIASVADKIQSTNSEGHVDGSTQEADLETACNTYGLSKEEYRAAQNALRVKENLSRLENYLERSPPGRFREDEEAIESIIWDTIVTLSGRESPFHPLLLKLLGMNASNLKDRIQEIIAMSQGTTGPFEPHIADQIRNEVKRNYGIP